MPNLIDMTRQELEHIVTRSSGRCIVYQDVDMPVGTIPVKARVGFEADQNGGQLRLLVDRAEQQDCPSPSVSEWLTTGERTFASHAELLSWINQELRSCFEAVEPSTEEPSNRHSIYIDLPAPKDSELQQGSIYDKLSPQIFGQDSALKAIATDIERHIAKPFPKRPLSLFLVGPTGVGKTMTAEACANALTELSDIGDWGWARLDMCEYREAHRVSQLLGAPAGYVGHGSPTQLTSILRANERSIVLFDEIEKAHPLVFSTLMNMLDSGRLSTPVAQGGQFEIDCSKAIFVFTSNASADSIQAEIERQNETSDARAASELIRNILLGSSISPEILGRINRFVPFLSLGAKANVQIVTAALKSLAAEYGVEIVNISPQAKQAISMLVSTNRFGARPLN